MLLPNGKKAFIELPKLTDYLLSENHSVGKSKAKFFREIGTVWIIDTGKENPRFVTARPFLESKD